tara:strand:+ start:388 stop:2427 length:2040 start_codon:yes stop_codon:yes gene_type:complete
MANVTNIEIRAQDKTTTAFRKVGAGLGRLDGKVANTKRQFALLNGGLSSMVGLMGGVFGVAAVVNFSKNLLEIGDRMHKVSGALGLTVPKLQAFQFAASQSGIDTETMHKALGKFNIEIGIADGKLLGANTKFSDLGINIHDVNGDLKDSPQLFADVSEKIAEIEEPAQKAAAAASLFGKGAVDLLPLLNTGKDGVKAFEEQLVASGAIISQEAAEDIAKFNDQIDIMQRTIRGNLAPVLVAILPALAFLAQNIDTVAIAVGALAGAFVVAKIGASIGAITTAVNFLSVAWGLSPLAIVGIAAGAITTLGLAAYTYKDDIAEFFSFGESAPKVEATKDEVVKLNTAVGKTIKNEEEKVKIQKDFVKFNKKDVIPNLKKLEEGLGETQLKFVSLTGREGLGGIQLAFRDFFMNVWSDATFYLGGTSQTIKTNFSNMKQDFEEFFKALDNIVIFEGKEVKAAFSAIMTNLLGSVNTNAPLIKTAFEKVMTNLEKQVQNMKIKVEGITIDIPASAFSFANTKATVPATIFDFSAVRSAAGAIDSLVEQINTYSYSKTKRTTSRGAMSVGRSRNSLLAKSIKPIWSDEYEASENSEVYGASTLKMPIPSVSISGTSASSPSSSPSSSSSPSPASKNASKGGGDNGVTVNIYDGTGQKISAYDSGIRVEITERASRNNQFAALL